jgi:hypothetical protein
MYYFGWTNDDADEKLNFIRWFFFFSSSSFDDVKFVMAVV